MTLLLRRAGRHAARRPPIGRLATLVGLPAPQRPVVLASLLAMAVSAASLHAQDASAVYDGHSDAIAKALFEPALVAVQPVPEARTTSVEAFVDGLRPLEAELQEAVREMEP